MNEDFEIITIDETNVDERGFFCYMSKRNSPGYQQKRVWLESRFAEGMRIKILHEIGGRDVGFIEYLPGEYAWRAVNAPGYLLVHCLWVVGKGKGKGYGTYLLQECLQDARAQKKRGVVMVSSDRIWLAGKEIFLKNGFLEVDQALPFRLLVHSFHSRLEPSFPTDWDDRQKRFGPGLTVIRTPQCPYIENGVADIMQTAGELGIPAKVVEFESAQELQEKSPSAFGVFGIVHNGKLLSYYYLKRSKLEERLRESTEGG